MATDLRTYFCTNTIQDFLLRPGGSNMPFFGNSSAISPVSCKDWETFAEKNSDVFLKMKKETFSRIGVLHATR